MGTGLNAYKQLRGKLKGIKPGEIKTQLKDLKILHDELQILINLCAGSTDGCPILEGFDSGESVDKQKNSER